VANPGRPVVLAAVGTRRYNRAMSKRPGTVCIIHHSHTDIGYTETQQRITRWHVDFIRQALACLPFRRRKDAQ
jgi:hypothetical protein